MQSIPLAVLKPTIWNEKAFKSFTLHAIHTACGIETSDHLSNVEEFVTSCMQSIPLAVLKRYLHQRTS